MCNITENWFLWQMNKNKILAFLTQFFNFCNSVTRQPIELKICSKHLQIQVEIEIIFFFGFSVSDVTMRACFRNFLTNFTRPWAPTQWAIFWLKLYLETTLCSTSSELLNDFLAYLEPKLWAKTKIGKNLCTHKPQAQVDYTHILYGHNSPVDWARELFKPFIDGVKSL